MSGPEIHDYSLGSGAAAPIAPTSGTAPTESTQTSKGYSSVSQIEESKSVVVEVPLLAEAPQLTAAKGDAAAVFGQLVATSAIMNHQLQANQIMIIMLNKWSESIKEEKERVRDLLRSPLYQQIQEIQKVGHANTVTESRKVEQPMIVNATDRLNDYLERIGTSDGTSQNLSAAPTVSAVVILGPMMIVTADPVSFASPSSPMATISQVSTSMQQVVPPLVDIASALDVNLMVPLMQVAWEVAVGKTKAMPSEFQCATKFAQQVIQMATSPNWIQMTVINNIPGAEKLDPKGKQELTAVLKLTMVLVALAYLYKAETGGITSQEIMDRVKGMLAGTIPLKEGSEEATLVMIMRAQLQVLDPTTKEKALTAMMTAIDNPNFVKNLGKMSDPLKAFENVFENVNYNSKDLDIHRA
jgi:hypothetical protein